MAVLYAWFDLIPFACNLEPLQSRLHIHICLLSVRKWQREMAPLLILSTFLTVVPVSFGLQLGWSMRVVTVLICDNKQLC